MDYSITQKLTWNCRLLSVIKKRNRKNNSRFIVAKYGKSDNGELLFSIIYDESAYDFLKMDMKSHSLHTVDRIAIQPNIPLYHIYTWDDVENELCSREHVGEVQRDDEGNPIKFSQIVVFANLDNKLRPTIQETLDKHYIAINSPIVGQFLNFNNEEHYWKLRNKDKNQKEQECQEDYDEYMSNVYESYEKRRCAEMDMTEEDRIMSALEDGNGELYGF